MVQTKSGLCPPFQTAQGGHASDVIQGAGLLPPSYHLSVLYYPLHGQGQVALSRFCSTETDKSMGSLKWHLSRTHILVGRTWSHDPS